MINELILLVRIIGIEVVHLVVMLSASHRVVAMVYVRVIVAVLVVAFQNLFLFKDVKHTMMDVMSVQFLAVMLLLVQSVPVFGRVSHHALRVNLAIY